MSDATHRPGPPEDDAWARACAEDLEAERARRGRGGPPPGSAAEELRKLADALADKVSSLGTPLLGAGAQSAVRQAVAQARSAIEPVVERNPEVFDHLAAAGGELLAAYRSAVRGHEHRWTRGTPPPRDPAAPGDDGGPDGSHRIDLD
ncbi:DUF5304 family protein [Streptomyces somaliensis]|uniref:DUF5304 domain-containing protein n=1 Tax=Streptomyces somaliensis (strain ATCC 33201 / DSM 40738 / JCM 12659 / KCTC 9044 / NCTC 11332 / NRRL B-12077 / IP 733) TaxID=1134445 RepID=A0AA44DEW1_STRE0|nr:DUF5304 family protein [Streptomyces somaliensis]NKY15364.1 DUF5304 domain-containing protein [Streptomyces somaliensis DSM 40738]